MEQITNIAQFKKALKIGRLVDVTHFKYSRSGPDGKVNFEKQIQPTRPISVIQTRDFAIKAEIEPRKFVDAWMTYPKASEAEFKDNKMHLYAKHPQYGYVLLSIYSFPDIPSQPEVKSAAEIQSAKDLKEIFSTPTEVHGKQCYMQF